MENLKKHYEKIALAVGVLVFLLLAFFAYKQIKAIPTDFEIASKKARKVKPYEGAKTVDNAITHLASKKKWQRGEREGRPLSTFTGISIYQVEGQDRPVDPLSKESSAIHPPIPNRWFIEYDIDLSYKDSLNRDPDRDGYSNLEEFTAKKSPTDFKDHPPLIDKFRISNIKKFTFLLTFSGAAEDTFAFQYRDSKRHRKRAVRGNYVKRGEPLFDAKKGVTRFVLKDIILQKKLNTSTNIEEEILVAQIQDLKPSAGNRIIEVPRGRKNGKKIVEYEAKAYLNAVKQAGITIDLKPLMTFSLPYRADAPEAEKLYQVEAITKTDVRLSFLENGQKKTKTIKKE